MKSLSIKIDNDYDFQFQKDFKKILKRFKVTPISPIKLLMVQLSIYILYCLLSLIILLITASLFYYYHLAIHHFYSNIQRD